MGNLEEALNSLYRSVKFHPPFTPILAIHLAITNALLGRMKEARQFIAPFIKMGWNLECLMGFCPLKDPNAEELCAEGLLKAGVQGEPDGYYKSAIFLKPNLNGEEIKELVFERSVSGFARCSGQEWSIERSEDGKAIFRSGEIADTGKSWIDGDKLCNQWDNLYGGFKDCMRVYVNQEGTKEKKNQYIGTTVYGPVPFSVVK